MYWNARRWIVPLLCLLLLYPLVPPVQTQAEGEEYYASVLRELEAQGIDTAGAAFLYGDTEAEVMTVDDYTTPDTREGIFKLDGANPQLGTASVVDVTGQPFAKAIRVKTLAAAANPWDVNLKGLLNRPVRQNDVLYAVAYFRAVEASGESGMVKSSFYMKDEVTGTMSGSWVLTNNDMNGGGKWQKYAFVAKAVNAVPPEETLKAWAEFFLGYKSQTVEIGGIAILNFGQKDQAFIDALPKTVIDLNYEGRDPNAPWRAEAEARIEQLRKGELKVTVTDGSGNPIPGAVIKVRMTRHAFGFGTAANAARVADGSGNNELFQKALYQYFNKVVFENNLKWQGWNALDWGSSYRREDTLAALDILQAKGIPVKGHTLVWPRWDVTPSSVYQQVMAVPAEERAAKLKQLVDDHIADKAGTLAGRLAEWDVVNEPYESRDYSRILHPDNLELPPSYADWFKLAKQYDSSAQLMLTDNGMLPFGKDYSADYFYNLVGYLLAEGAPVEALGEQAHFSHVTLTPPELLWAKLDRFHDRYGLPIHITEFDINIEDRGIADQVAVQADYTRDFLTAMFSHEAVASIMSWGFWQGDHWMPNAAYFNEDWSLRPHGQAYADLVYGKWWTNADGVSDERGEYAVRGFLGDYEIIASKDGMTDSAAVSLTKSGAQAAIVLTPEDTDEPPSVPANLKAVARNIGDLTVSWDAAADDTGIVNYNVYVNGAAEPYNSEPLRGTFLKLANLSADTAYRIAVKAVDATGNESIAASELVVSTLPYTLPRDEWTAVAKSFYDVPWGNFRPQLALDRDSGTEWLNGESMHLNQYYQIDMKSSRTIGRITALQGSNNNFPESFSIYVSDVSGVNGSLDLDRSVLGQPVHTMTGNTSNLLDVTLPAVTGRYITIANDAYKADWWSIKDIQVYPGEAPEPSGENDILSFHAAGSAGVIDPARHTVTVTVPFGTDVTGLAPELTVSDKAAVTPASGVPQNFGSPVAYTVTAEDGSTQTWLVTVVVDADRTPPTAPNLSYEELTYRSVKLVWSGSTDNDAVASYEVYQDGNRIASVTEPGLTIDKLKQGTSYRFTVTAIDRSGLASAPSPELTVTLPHRKLSKKRP